MQPEHSDLDLHKRHKTLLTIDPTITDTINDMIDAMMVTSSVEGMNNATDSNNKIDINTHP